DLAADDGVRLDLPLEVDAERLLPLAERLLARLGRDERGGALGVLGAHRGRLAPRLLRARLRVSDAHADRFDLADGLDLRALGLGRELGVDRVERLFRRLAVGLGLDELLL